MKERYLDIMSRVVDVYSPERFDAYIEKVRTDGITEHGFPRLCANIGILMAHGRKLELKHRFDEMMDLCCRDLPALPIKGKRGNDFSVREIVSCILELEAAQLYPAETINAWKKAISAIEPKIHYRMVAPEPPVAVDNWAAFNAASEQMRCMAGLTNTHAYIENQIASQMFSFDENGMYRDPNDPMVYDVVTRNMLSACLFYGYNGTHRKMLAQHLRKAAEMTLLMQSVTGELPYGGRSNQFLHNEVHLAVCFEYEATCRKQLGDPNSASRFKAAAKLALDTVEHWLDNAPGQHIKNYFPIDSKIGCEDYAYYDKYMITVASFLYLAYSFCDDSILPTGCPALQDGSYALATSDAFRKVFCKSGPYFLEAELSSDPHYDSCGIGRIHRRGAPSAICLSVPASRSPNYEIGIQNPLGLSICCGMEVSNKWQYCSDPNGHFILESCYANDILAFSSLRAVLPGGQILKQAITVTEDGVSVTVNGTGTVGLLLPAFFCDGATTSEIESCYDRLSIRYKGWSCIYETNGSLMDLDLMCTNRNGKYKIFRAQAKDALTVHISITQNS